MRVWTGHIDSSGVRSVTEHDDGGVDSFAQDLRPIVGVGWGMAGDSTLKLATSLLSRVCDAGVARELAPKYVSHKLLELSPDEGWVISEPALLKWVAFHGSRELLLARESAA